MRKKFTLLPGMDGDPLSLYQVNRVIGPHWIVANDADFSRVGADSSSDDLSVDHYPVRGLRRPATGRTLLRLFPRAPQRQARVRSADHQRDEQEPSPASHLSSQLHLYVYLD
jgi:hypothetical protein